MGLVMSESAVPCVNTAAAESWIRSQGRGVEAEQQAYDELERMMLLALSIDGSAMLPTPAWGTHKEASTAQVVEEAIDNPNGLILGQVLALIRDASAGRAVTEQAKALGKAIAGDYAKTNADLYAEALEDDGPDETDDRGDL